MLWHQTLPEGEPPSDGLARAKGANQHRPRTPRQARAELNRSGPRRERHAQHIRRTLGLTQPADQPAQLSPPLLTQTANWVKGLAESAKALAQPGSWPPGAQARSTYRLAQGGVGLGPTRFNASYLEKHEASSPADYQRALSRVLGPSIIRMVHDLPDGVSASAFVRNMVGEGPGGMLLRQARQQTRTGDVIRQTVRSLIHFFEQQSIRYEQLNFDVNFANVLWVPSQDTLVLANTAEQNVDQLVERYGNPTNVISVRLDHKGAVARNGESLCYDLDLALAVVESRSGQPIALLHEACIDSASDASSWFARARDTLAQWLGQGHSLRELLQSLGFTVVLVNAEDHAQLALNLVTDGLPPGQALFTRPISDALTKQLNELGVDPVFSLVPPLPGHLGTMGSNSPFGWHCVTIGLPLPSAPQALSEAHGPAPNTEL